MSYRSLGLIQQMLHSIAADRADAALTLKTKWCRSQEGEAFRRQEGEACRRQEGEVCRRQEGEVCRRQEGEVCRLRQEGDVWEEDVRLRQVSQEEVLWGQEGVFRGREGGQEGVL